MVAIGIVAILASVAIPSYNAYMIRAHVAELFEFGSAAKTAVTAIIQDNGFTSTSAMQSASPNPIASLASNYSVSSTSNLASLVIQSSSSNNGTIYIVGAAPTQGVAFKLIPTVNGDGSVSWACNGCTGTPTQYLPAACASNTTCP